MKIQQHDIIKLAGSARVHGIFKNIPAGRELSALIVQRIDGKTAELSINGKMIRADFLKGVPPGDTISLKFEKNVNDTYIFKIVQHTGADALNNKLAEFIILTNSMVKDRYGDILKFIQSSQAGIYELNRLLINPDSRNKKEGRNVLLLNRLLKAGMDINLLVYLSSVMSGRGFNRDILLWIRSLIGAPLYSGEKECLLKNNEIDGIISDIISGLDSINDRDLKSDAITQILDALMNEPDEKGIEERELYYLEDSEFKAMNYFFSYQALMFTLNLSNIGIIEIIVKKADNAFFINIFSDRENVIEFLKKTEGTLREGMRKIRGGVSVNFINSKIMLDNLKDFYRNYVINKIDLKV